MRSVFHNYFLHLFPKHSHWCYHLCKVILVGNFVMLAYWGYDSRLVFQTVFLSERKKPNTPKSPEKDYNNLIS